jgi:hypothetical protein
MSDKSLSTAVISTSAAYSDSDLNRENRLPFLQRNRKRRHEMVMSTTPASDLRKQKILSCKSTSYIDSASDLTASNCDNVLSKNKPFLVRNLRIKQMLTLKDQKTTTATKGDEGVSHYRVHCITNEINEKVNSTFKSFLCPVYECPFCGPFNGVGSIFSSVTYTQRTVATSHSYVLPFSVSMLPGRL